MCLPTPSVEIRCDNKAAIVLATGEGSWRTKGAANKIYSIREKVEKGKLRVSYVGTKDQCADSLTKFLKGGPDQNKAREHLSLRSIEDGVCERDTHARVSGLRTSLRTAGSSGPQLFRVECSSPDSFVPQLSGSGSFGPLSSARRKKRLCHLCQKMNLSHELRPVAISAVSTREVCVSEFYHRDGARTENKCPIMVKIFPTIKKEVSDTDEQPNWGDPKDEIKEAWRLESFDEIEHKLSSNVKKRGMHPVDPIAVTLKTSPIPLKDVPRNWLELNSNGWYGGHNIVDTLQADTFEAVIDGVGVEISRWVLFNVPENTYKNAHIVAANVRAKTERTHGQATIKTALETAVPSTFKIRKEEKSPKPILGIRVFHGGPSQAMNEWVYQSYYGYMHVNLAQDGHLHDGVYCWNDVRKAIDSFKEDYAKHPTQTKCLGVVEGYLHYKHGDKMSLRARSTKLIAIFAPFDEEIHMPFELGVEDALAFRLPPHQIGGPIKWFRTLYNIDGTTYTKSAIMSTFDSGDWPTPLSESLREECANLARYNAQRSMNQEDQIRQKTLYIKLMKEPLDYNKEDFALALASAPFAHKGRLPPCMKYIHDGAKKDVTAHKGLWRLWDPPKDVPTAKEVYESEKKAPKEEKRLRHNVNSTLEERRSADPDPLSLSLAENIKLNKLKGTSDDDDSDDESQDNKTMEDVESAASSENKQAGKPGSSTDVPGQKGSGSKNPVLTPPYNRNKGRPDSPVSIERMAKSHWNSFGIKIKHILDTDYPRRFVEIRGQEHWDFTEVTHGLTFQTEDYSPIMQWASNGNLIYQDVPAYDAKWLPRDANKKIVSPRKRISFNPAHAWIEDRWVFCRRMEGDLFCQVVFYYVCEFVWKKNDIHGKQRYNRQEAMLTSLFQIDDTEAWRNEYTKEESIVPVLNWKGDFIVHATRPVVNKIVGEACMLGPIAAMFGREFQQYLLEHRDRTTIRAIDMQKSVDKGRASLGSYDIKDLHTEAVNKSTKGTTSKVQKRTRTPPRDQEARGHAQAPWKDNRRTSHPAHRRDNRREETMKKEYDARYQDIRYNPNFQRMQQQKRNQMEIERLQQEQEFLRQQDLLDQDRLRDSRARARQKQNRDSSRSEERRTSRSSHHSSHRDERPRAQRQSNYDKPRRSFHKDDHRPRR